MLHPVGSDVRNAINQAWGQTQKNSLHYSLMCDGVGVSSSSFMERLQRKTDPSSRNSFISEVIIVLTQINDGNTILTLPRAYMASKAMNHLEKMCLSYYGAYLPYFSSQAKIPRVSSSMDARFSSKLCSTFCDSERTPPFSL